VRVLFVHRSFPAQLGHVAARLAADRGWKCTFVSEAPAGETAGIRLVQYRPDGGATERTHYFARTFENAVAHAAGVYQALRPLRDELSPDLVVGHSGFGSTLFLPELWPGAALLGYFEYFYRPHGSDLDFRPDYPPADEDVLRARARNAMILLDLEQCDAGVSPTEWQRDRFPEPFRPRIRVVHDGVDTSVWRPRENRAEVRAALGLAADARLVTYVSRGLESMRGFDVFMRAAKLVVANDPEAVCLVVGEEKVAYGGDLRHTGGRSFKEHVLAQDEYDLERIRFLGRVEPRALAELLAAADVHVYLTVPFVLSWSLLDAMASGCVVVASDTEPVREVVRNGENGILRGFFDHEGIAEAVLCALARPDEHRALAEAALGTVRERFSLDVTLPALAALYEQVHAAREQSTA
jgi:glycosyltransferase involved in cell wall biosynthesis